MLNEEFFYGEEERVLDFRTKPTKEIINEKMGVLYDFGLFEKGKKDARLRKDYIEKLQSCPTILSLEVMVKQLIKESFDKADLLMVP